MSTVEVLLNLEGIYFHKSEHLTPTEVEALFRAIIHFRRLVDRQKGGTLC